MEVTPEAMEANTQIQVYEDKYRIAYKTIMELIISNFETKNYDSGFQQSVVEQLKIEPAQL